MADCCYHGNVPASSTNNGEIFEEHSYYVLLEGLYSKKLNNTPLLLPSGSLLTQLKKHRWLSSLI